jgi:integration host factor subunit beta
VLANPVIPNQPDQPYPPDLPTTTAKQTMDRMTKAELVEEVSRVSDLTKKHSEVIVDTVFKSIIDALHRGEKIELRGFGSFRLRKREPRKGRNPKTGDKVDVPPKRVPYFKPGKELKDLINKEAEEAETPSQSSPDSATP